MTCISLGLNHTFPYNNSVTVEDKMTSAQKLFIQICLSIFYKPNKERSHSNLHYKQTTLHNLSCRTLRRAFAVYKNIKIQGTIDVGLDGSKKPLLTVAAALTSLCDIKKILPTCVDGVYCQYVVCITYLFISYCILPEVFLIFLRSTITYRVRCVYNDTDL